MLERLQNERFDLIVIGAGITGSGVALDAASRGLKVALIEKTDFASGTSSKSSKLAHGGLRYLQQGDIGLVYEALRERQRMLRTAPHLVRLLPFLIPVTSGKGGTVNRKTGWALGKAMWLYDLTGGARIGKFHKKISAAETLRHFPTMPSDTLSYGYVYYDATVDDARLCLAVAQTAAAHGAVVANYTSVVGLLHNQAGQLDGVTVRADLGAKIREFTVRASVIVNAAGVWSDTLRAMDEGSDPDSIRPAKGIHITVPWHLVRNDIAAVIPVPGEKRTLFVVPWLSKPDGTFTFTYIGTTDTDYTGPVDDPQCTPDDVAYVLRALNAAITTTITTNDVVGAWAGLRPLVKADSSGRTADLSRRHKVASRPNGLITVTGGKLTTYREMAEDTVDEVVKRLNRDAKSQTANLGLVGAQGYERPDMHTERTHLDERYGVERSSIDALIAGDPSLGQPLIPGLPYLRAEAIHACRHEMVVTLDDILSRRTRSRLQARTDTVALAGSVAELVGIELGWDAEETRRQVTMYVRSVHEERAADELPDVLLATALAGS